MQKLLFSTAFAAAIGFAGIASADCSPYATGTDAHGLADWTTITKIGTDLLPDFEVDGARLVAMLKSAGDEAPAFGTFPSQVTAVAFEAPKAGLPYIVPQDIATLVIDPGAQFDPEAYITVSFPAVVDEGAPIGQFFLTASAVTEVRPLNDLATFQVADDATVEPAGQTNTGLMVFVGASIDVITGSAPALQSTVYVG